MDRNRETPLLKFVPKWDEPEFDYEVNTGKYARLLKWTTEAPTKEGWYWAWDGKYRYSIVKIEYSIAGYVMTGFQGNPPPLEEKNWKPDDFFTHWLGPLPTPEAPKK